MNILKKKEKKKWCTVGFTLIFLSALYMSRLGTAANKAGCRLTRISQLTAEFLSKPAWHLLLACLLS